MDIIIIIIIIIITRLNRMTISVIKTAINISEKGSVWTISGAPRTALVFVQNNSKGKTKKCAAHANLFFAN